MRKRKLLIFAGIATLVLSTSVYAETKSRSLKIDTGAYISGYLDAVNYSVPSCDKYTYKAEQLGAYKTAFTSTFETYYVNTMSGEKKKYKAGYLDESKLGITTGYQVVSVTAMTSGRYAYLSITSGAKTLAMMADFD